MILENLGKLYHLHGIVEQYEIYRDMAFGLGKSPDSDRQRARTPVRAGRVSEPHLSHIFMVLLLIPSLSIQLLLVLSWDTQSWEQPFLVELPWPVTLCWAMCKYWAGKLQASLFYTNTNPLLTYLSLSFHLSGQVFSRNFCCFSPLVMHLPLLEMMSVLLFFYSIKNAMAKIIFFACDFHLVITLWIGIF